MKDYLLRVINGKENDFKAKIVVVILNVLATIYNGLLKLRALAYKVGLKKSQDLCSPVISIGNITVGGTGKTPLVKFLATEFKQRDLETAILTSGYKSEAEDDLIVVSDGKKILVDVEQAGDEAYLLARNLEEVPVISGRQRSLTGDYACRKYKPDFIILDDGFQHWQLNRDYDIVVIDGTNPFSNGRLLPSGLLREPVSSLKRANAFVITKADQITGKKLAKIKQEIRAYNSDAVIITTKHSPGYLREIGSSKQEKIELKDKRIVAVSGIGNPESFTETLTSLEAEVVEHFKFPDHYQYDTEDIMEIYATATTEDVDMIITTEKDAVSIETADFSEIIKGDLPFKVLGIEIEIIDSRAKFLEVLDDLEVSE